jgi:CO/xanthine dehydrogenase Mo-binding subunit
MTTRYFGERIKRNEDPRLLTGQGLYVDDVDLPNMLHAAFLRSPYAHARINHVDISHALQREGVVAIYTAEDLGDYWKPGPLLVSPPPVKDIVFNEKTQVPLAKDKVKFAGEPIVMVLAESRYIAEDALADIQVDYEPLEAVVDLEKALTSNSPLIHEEVGSNVAAHVIQTKGNYQAAKKDAALVIKRRFRYEHGCAAAIENRGIVAEWDRRAGRLTVWDTTQAPVVIRNGLAGMLGLSERNVRVIAPFIGGGFGPKIMMFYQEEVLVPWAAMRLNRPVKWIEDRAENFVATTHERGQIHDAEAAFDKEGRILGVHDVFLHDTGAYAPYGLTMACLSSRGCSTLQRRNSRSTVPKSDGAISSRLTNSRTTTKSSIRILSRLCMIVETMNRCSMRRSNESDIANLLTRSSQSCALKGNTLALASSPMSKGQALVRMKARRCR